MKKSEIKNIKENFQRQLEQFAKSLKSYLTTSDSNWTIKGFIDVFENIYSISSDTKIISKVLEIHLVTKFLEFAENNNYKIIFAEKQNWYPDLSFVSLDNEQIKFAVDLKTTYRLDTNPNFCNGFTLGSHGEYFINRNSTKNIQFPYGDYFGHYCLCILYSRNSLSASDETKIYTKENLNTIPSVIKEFEIFVAEKWKIASDKGGSGNTANIGSISYIPNLINCKGTFSNIGEEWFDDYWKNYNKITITNSKGQNKKITSIKEFLLYRGKSLDWINKHIEMPMSASSIKKAVIND